MKIKSGDKIIDLNQPNKKFDDCRIKYKISVMDTHRTIKQDSLSHKYITRYFDNPLYFKNCFQYLFGGFYRAVHGIIKLGGKIDEKNLDDSIVNYFKVLEENNLYNLKILRMTRKTNIKGRPWKGCNTELPMNVRLKTELHMVHKGDIIYLRRDATDLPAVIHVELYDRHVNKVKVIRLTEGMYYKLLDRSEIYKGKNPLPNFKKEVNGYE